MNGTYEMTASTVCANPPKFSEDPAIEGIMEYVRHASNDEDAIHNLKLELKAYDRRKTFKDLWKLFLNL